MDDASHVTPFRMHKCSSKTISDRIFDEFFRKFLTLCMDLDYFSMVDDDVVVVVVVDEWKITR